MADEPTMRIPLRTCMRCGKPVVAGMKECFSCGAPVDEEKKPDDQLTRCPTCGKELVRGAIVCSLCGTRLRPERATNGTTSPTAPQSPAPIPLTTLEEPPPSSFPSLDKVPLLGMTRRMGFRLGAVTFLLAGFLGGKLLFRSLPTEVPAGEQPLLSTAREQPTSPSAETSPPSPSLPASEVLPQRALPKGRVVTADGLARIQVFGPGANHAKRAAPVLRERVEEFLPSIRSVYSEKLSTTQQLFGIITLELSLTAAGRVAQVDVHTTGLENPEFLQIVRGLVQEWKFEPAAGATTVFYPLLFIPTELDPFSLIGLSKDLLPGRYRMLGGEPTPVRLRPGDDGTEVGRVSPGLRVDVVGSQKGWLAVLSPKGKVGYVRRDVISPRVDDERPAS